MELESGKLQKYDDHLRLLFKIHDTYRKKNHDYGDSFSDLFKKFGLVSPVIKLYDKMSRLESLCNKEALVNDESIEDTLLDMANYAIMTVLELQGECNRVDQRSFDYSKLPKVVAIDFDKTLAINAEFPDIGEPNTVLINEIWNGKYKDYKKILWTHRNGNSLEEALKWCEEQGLVFDAINENIAEVKDLLNGGPLMKIWFDVFIDDKVLNVDEFGEPRS